MIISFDISEWIGTRKTNGDASFQCIAIHILKNYKRDE